MLTKDMQARADEGHAGQGSDPRDDDFNVILI